MPEANEEAPTLEGSIMINTLPGNSIPNDVTATNHVTLIFVASNNAQLKLYSKGIIS